MIKFPQLHHCGDSRVSRVHVAFEFPQCVVAFFIMVSIRFWKSYVSKSKLCDGESWFISKEATVLTPLSIIIVTITFYLALFTWVIHAACAAVFARQCSAPVGHLTWVTGYPPSKRIFPIIFAIKPQPGVKAFILNKLFTVWGDLGETRQLRQICSHVMNVTWVAPRIFAAIHKFSVLAIVTDDCHANAVLVSHITKDKKRR